VCQIAIGDAGMPEIYLIARSNGTNKLKASRVGLSEGLPGGRACLSKAIVKLRSYLYCYGQDSDTLDVYEFLASSPWLRKLKA